MLRELTLITSRAAKMRSVISRHHAGLRRKRQEAGLDAVQEVADPVEARLAVVAHGAREHDRLVRAHREIGHVGGLHQHVGPVEDHRAHTEGDASARSMSRARRNMCSGVMCGLGRLDQSTGLKPTSRMCGRSSANNRSNSLLGTTPRSSGRGRIVMVPPVKNTTTHGKDFSDEWAPSGPPLRQRWASRWKSDRLQSV